MSLTEEQFTQALLQDWAADTQAVLLDVLRRRGEKVPQETLRNLSYKVAGNTYELFFQDSGRHVDMRSLEFRRRAISRDQNFILEWVKRRGAGSFRYVPGYEGRDSSRLTTAQKESRIASAIIASRGSRVKTARRRRGSKWFNQTFYSQVEVLVGRYLDEYREFVAQQARETAQNNLTAG